VLAPNRVIRVNEEVGGVWQQLGFIVIEAGALPGQFGVGVLAPQLLFYLGLRQGLMAALAATGGWTVGLQLYGFMRRRRLDPVLLYGFVFTVLQSAVALYARSALIYAGGKRSSGPLG
jgi:hypothetical protein